MAKTCALLIPTKFGTARGPWGLTVVVVVLVVDEAPGVVEVVVDGSTPFEIASVTVAPVGTAVGFT